MFCRFDFNQKIDYGTCNIFNYLNCFIDNIIFFIFHSTRKKERERKARKQEGNMTKRGQRLGTFKKRYYIFRESLLKKI